MKKQIQEIEKKRNLFEKCFSHIRTIGVKLSKKRTTFRIRKARSIKKTFFQFTTYLFSYSKFELNLK